MKHDDEWLLKGSGLVTGAKFPKKQEGGIRISELPRLPDFDEEEMWKAFHGDRWKDVRKKHEKLYK